MAELIGSRVHCGGFKRWVHSQRSWASAQASPPRHLRPWRNKKRIRWSRWWPSDIVAASQVSRYRILSCIGPSSDAGIWLAFGWHGRQRP
jgi:hypothetical protein